jgi:hypothetical protein
MENDTYVEDEIRLAFNPSVFPNLGKLRPADKFKMKLVSEIKIKTDWKLNKNRRFVYLKKPTLEISKDSLRVENVDLNNVPPDDLDNGNDLIEHPIRIEDPLEVLDRHDIDVLDGFNNIEILFKRIPFDVRNDIARKFKDYCDEFDDSETAPVKK